MNALAVWLSTLAAAASAGLSTPASQPRLLGGPALAGRSVVWTDVSGRLRAGQIGSAPRVLYRVPDGFQLGGIAGSTSAVAFTRAGPTCPPQPNFVCPIGSDLWAGPARGALAELVRLRVWCGAPSFDVDGTRVAYAAAGCADGRVPARTPVVVRDLVTGKARTLALVDCCAVVRLAGQYAAWSSHRNTRIVLYDLRAGRVAEILPVTDASGLVFLDFDLQRDGQIAAAFHLANEDAAGPSTVLWFSRDAPYRHELPLAASTTELRIAGGRILLKRPYRLHGGELDLVNPRTGARQTVVRATLPFRLRGDFDFDGRRVTWASDRIDSSSVNCPPPGVGAPCMRVESGVTTIRLQRLGSTSQVVAQLPFADAPAQ